MKRTEKFVDEILQSKKEKLQEVAYEAVKDLFSFPYHGRNNIVLGKAITEDINEKIDLFLIAEGYNNGEKNESNT
jgi:hypothetical protein